MRAKTVIAIVLAILLVIFSLQNVEVVKVKFLSWSFELSRVLLIIGTFGVGVLVGILVSIRKKTTKKIEKKTEVKEQKVID